MDEGCSSTQSRPIHPHEVVAGHTGRVQPPGARNTMDRQTLSIMKACEVVGVSRRTIYNWIAAGKVEYVRTAGGSIRIFADSLWRDPAESPRASAPASTPAAGSHV